MERDQLRLELLKLAYKPHEHPKNAVETAEVLEAYVLGEEIKAKVTAPTVATQSQPQGKHGKNKSGNHPFS